VIKLPLAPKNPDRVCWGCDKFCPAEDLRCGNGTIRCPHPIEIFGDDWMAEVLGVSGQDAPDVEPRTIS
jgi:hypothetical protein